MMIVMRGVHDATMTPPHAVHVDQIAVVARALAAAIHALNIMALTVRRAPVGQMSDQVTRRHARAALMIA
jgi:hypothetical protein